MLGVVMWAIIPHMIYLFYTGSAMNEMQRYQPSGSVSQTPVRFSMLLGKYFRIIYSDK